MAPLESNKTSYPPTTLGQQLGFLYIFPIKLFWSGGFKTFFLDHFPEKGRNYWVERVLSFCEWWGHSKTTSHTKKKINNREPDKLCCCFFITRRQNSLDAAAFFSFFIIACAIKMEVRGKSRANPKTKIDDVWSRNDMQLARGKATTKNESTALNSRHTHTEE